MQEIFLSKMTSENASAAFSIDNFGAKPQSNFIFFEIRVSAPHESFFGCIGTIQNRGILCNPAFGYFARFIKVELPESCF